MGISGKWEQSPNPQIQIPPFTIFYLGDEIWETNRIKSPGFCFLNYLSICHASQHTYFFTSVSPMFSSHIAYNIPY